LHFKTKSGIKNFTNEQAEQLKGDVDYATRDLMEHMDAGKTAEWETFVQVIP
jgi:catalase